jgi:hypothetical protein
MDVNFDDMTIAELRARAENGSDPVFATALVARIERQVRTIRSLFADVVRLSIANEAESA